MRFKINSNSAYEWLVAVYIWVLFKPFFVWQIPDIVLNILFISLIIPTLKKPRSASTSFFIFTMLILYLILSLRANFTVIYAQVVVLLPFTLFLISPKFAASVFEKFATVFAILIIPSLLMYFLVIFLEIPIPSRTIMPLNIIKEGVYNQYPFLVTYQSSIGFVLPRFYGYFDEPGVVGTVCAVLLVTRKSLNHWASISILIAGIFSTSMFFYAVVFITLLYRFPMKYKIALLIIVVALGIILYDNEFIGAFVIQRFSLTDDGTLAGMNRELAHFTIWYEQYFRHSENFLWGLGGGANLIHNLGGASYRDLIVQYGLIFFVAYMLAFSLFSLNQIGFNKNWIIYMMLFWGIIFQRPFITGLAYIVLFLFPIYVLSSRSKFNKEDSTEQIKVIDK